MTGYKGHWPQCSANHQRTYRRCYRLRFRKEGYRRTQCVLIFNLGGGTFDVNNGLESYAYNLRNTLTDDKLAGKFDPAPRGCRQ